MKKIAAGALIALLALSLIGCSSINHAAQRSGDSTANSNKSTTTQALEKPVIKESGWNIYTKPDGHATVNAGVIVSNPNTVPLYGIKIVATISMTGKPSATVDLAIASIDAGDSRGAGDGMWLDPLNAKVTNVNFEIVSFTKSPSTYSGPVVNSKDLVVSDIVYNKDSALPTITGKVTNKTGKDLSGAGALIMGRDASGKLLGTGTLETIKGAAGSSSLSAGSSGSFSFSVDAVYMPAGWKSYSIFIITS